MKVERPRARSSAAPTRAEQAVDDADRGARSPARSDPDLRQHGDQRVLAQEGGLAGHVRPGHQPGCGVPVSLFSAREPAIIADKVGAVAVARKFCSTMGWRPFDHGK